MVVPCIWFEIRVNYQLDANIAAFVKEIINSFAPENRRIGPKHVELK